MKNRFGQQQNIESTLSVVDVLKAYNGGTLPTSRADTDRIISSLPETTRNRIAPSNVLTMVQISLTPGLSEKVQKTVLANVDSVVDNHRCPRRRESRDLRLTRIQQADERGAYPATWASSSAGRSS